MDRWSRNTNVVKILALVIGILLWAVVHMEDNTLPGTSNNGVREEQISNVTVTPKYDSNQFYVQTMDPAEVIVTLSGKEAALKRQCSANIR